MVRLRMQKMAEKLLKGRSERERRSFVRHKSLNDGTFHKKAL